MPEIKLSFGKMDLESTPSGKDEQVAALLYNAFRKGNNLHRVPGLTEFADLVGLGEEGEWITETGPVYLYFSKLHNIFIAFRAPYLFKITVAGVVTPIVLMDGTELDLMPMSFAEDATKIYICSRYSIYSYVVLTNSIVARGATIPTGVTSIAIISGYLVANGQDPAGGSIAGDFEYCFLPTYPNLTVWEYQNNQAKPDALQQIITTATGDAFMVGSESTEVDYISNDPDAPFAVNKAASQAFGTPCPYSVAYDGQNLYMLVVVGGSRQILRLNNGRSPQIIGFPVTMAVDKINDISDANAYIVGLEGKTFYVITFPTAVVTLEDQLHNGLTLAFDIRNEEWHVWGDWDSQNGVYNAYRGVSFAYAEAWGNKRFIGGNDGKIYLMDDSRKFGDGIIRMAIRTGWRSHSTMRIKNSLFYSYDFKAGVGDETTTDPVFLHKWRNDGNLEWGNPRVMQMGATGQRSVPLQSRQCGRYRKRQDELVFSDAVEVEINGLYEEVEVLK